MTIITVVLSLYFAFKSGALKRLKIGSLEIEAPEKELEEARSIIASISAARGTLEDKIPFETEHLARYYAQVLFQSKVSFWFSLIFASLGFLVIVAAAYMYSDGKLGPTVIQGGAGVIVDAVAALFFVQSKRAQASMAEFFDKLRKDRQQVESRKLCDSVNNPDARDALRIQLSLYYAGVENYDKLAEKIFEECFGRLPANAKNNKDLEVGG